MSQKRVQNIIKKTNEIPAGFKQSEIGLIPEDWGVVRLEDISREMYYGITAKATDKKSSLKMLRTTDIKNYRANWEALHYCEITETRRNLNKYFIEKNDLIITRAGTTGVSVLVDKKLNNIVFGSYLIKVKLKENISTKFIHYFFQTHSYWKYITSSKTGVTLKNINLPILRSIILPLPPLSEQRKIARVLSKIQQAIDQQDKIIEATKNLKKSLMQKLFTEGIGHTEFKETGIGQIPMSWEVAKLGDVVRESDGLKRGPWGGSIKKEIFVPMGYKVYEQKNVILNNFTIGNYYIDYEKFKELQGFEVVSGDILITAAGTLGKLAIVPNDIKQGIINQALIRIRLKKHIDKYYFIFLFNFIVEHNILQKFSHGATLKNLSSVSVLKNIESPLPPLPEQQEIAHILSTVDDKIEVEEKRKNTLKELFKTILHKLMTGEIRVKDVKI